MDNNLIYLIIGFMIGLLVRKRNFLKVNDNIYYIVNKRMWCYKCKENYWIRVTNLPDN